MQKKKKPKFNVPNLGFFKSVKKRWRKPRGTHNKKRMKFKWAGASPKIGYRNPEAMRGLHPSGRKEVLINNMKELEGARDVLLRISAAVGARKRKLIEQKAKEMNLRIVNLRFDGHPPKEVFGHKADARAAAPAAASKGAKTAKK